MDHLKKYREAAEVGMDLPTAVLQRLCAGDQQSGCFSDVASANYFRSTCSKECFSQPRNWGMVLISPGWSLALLRAGTGLVLDRQLFLLSDTKSSQGFPTEFYGSVLEALRLHLRESGTDHYGLNEPLFLNPY